MERMYYTGLTVIAIALLFFVAGYNCHAEEEGTINIVSIYDEDINNPTAVEINYDGEMVFILRKDGNIALNDRVEKESVIALYEFFQTLIDIVEASRPTPAPADFP